MDFAAALDQSMENFTATGATVEEAFVLCACITGAHLNKEPLDQEGWLATLRKAQSMFRDGRLGGKCPYIDAAIARLLS